MKLDAMTRLAAVALTAVSVVVPSASRAAPLVSREVQCVGVAEVGSTAVCTASFELVDSRTPGELETHANFHTLTATGSITMKWLDANDNLYATFSCNAPGMYAIVDLPGGFAVQGGPADVSQYPNCSTTIEPGSTYARGTQTLVVTAHARQCLANNGNRSRCLFHGFLALSRSSIP